MPLVSLQGEAGQRRILLYRPRQEILHAAQENVQAVLNAEHKKSELPVTRRSVILIWCCLQGYLS
jgi:hypothetical protein